MNNIGKDNLQPLVSAVITTHNRKELVIKAIESVKKQTYSNIELIVVDDASTDDVHIELLSLAEKKNFHYIYIPESESLGGNHARNVGVQISRGKYIAFLDDDDEWMPEKIEKQVSSLEERSEYKICYCGKLREYNFGERTLSQSLEDLPEGDLSREILVKVLCTTSTMMIEREILLEVGMFDEGLRYWQEYELCIRLFQKTYVAVVRENLVLYRIIQKDRNRLTNQIVGWEQAVEQIYRKHADKMETLTAEEKKRQDLFRYYDGASRSNACGDKKNLRKYMLKIFHVSKNPRDLFKAIIGRYELKGSGKKILFFSGAYPNRGGANSMLTLIRQLRIKGYDVRLIIGKHGTAETIEQEFGVKSIFLKYYAWTIPEQLELNYKRRIKIQLKKIYNIYAEIRIYRFLRKFNPDIVVINSSDQYSGIWSCNRLGIPVVMHLREFMTLDHGKCYWSEDFARKYLSRLDGGIAISHEIKQYFLKYFSKDIEVIYNGVDVRKYRLSQQKCSCDQYKIVCVGKLCDGKNQMLALKAAKLLVENGTRNFRIYFYGDESDGYLAKLIKYCEESSINDYISFPGTTRNISEIYADAHINLLCSRNEAFGRVIIEGMLNHCLNVVSNSGGAKEIVSDSINGLLFENNNEASLFNVLKYALDHYEELRSVIDQGYNDANDFYTSEANADQVEKYLNKKITQNKYSKMRGKNRLYW